MVVLGEDTVGARLFEGSRHFFGGDHPNEKKAGLRGTNTESRQ